MLKKEIYLIVGYLTVIGFSILIIIKGDDQIITVTIAAIAVLVSVWNGISNREFNKLSLKPLISDEEFYDISSLEYEYSFSNKGVGPAIIDNFTYTFDGAPCSLNDLLEKLKLLDDNVGFVGEHGSTGNGAIHAAGEKKILLRFNRISPDCKVDSSLLEGYFINFVKQIRRRVGVKIEYSSVFETMPNFVSTQAEDLDDGHPFV